MVKRDGNILRGLSEIAAFLGINETQAGVWCRRKDFPAVQIEGKGPWRSEKQALSEWYAWFVKQNRRSPEMKRRRPEPAPDVADIRNQLEASALDELKTREAESAADRKSGGGKGAAGSE